MRSSDSAKSVTYGKQNGAYPTTPRVAKRSNAVLALMHEVLARLAIQVLSIGLLRAFDRPGGARAGVFRTAGVMRLPRGGDRIRSRRIESEGAAGDEDGKPEGARVGSHVVLWRSIVYPNRALIRAGSGN